MFLLFDNSDTCAIDTDRSQSCHAPAFPETMHHFVWRLPCFLTWWFIIWNLSVECNRHSAGTKPNTYLVEVCAWLWKQNLFPVILLKRKNILQVACKIGYICHSAQCVLKNVPTEILTEFLDSQEKFCRAKLRI